MKISIVTYATCAILVLTSGCTPLPIGKPMLGDSTNAVKALLGKPSAIHIAPRDTTLEYRSGSFGQHTWMARFVCDKLVSFDQVLSAEYLSKFKINFSTKSEVLLAIGHPSEKSKVAAAAYEVWSYRYKEAGVWNSQMHFHFDSNGILRLLLNGPDNTLENRELSYR